MNAWILRPRESGNPGNRVMCRNWFSHHSLGKTSAICWTASACPLNSSIIHVNCSIRHYVYLALEHSKACISHVALFLVKSVSLLLPSEAVIVHNEYQGYRGDLASFAAIERKTGAWETINKRWLSSNSKSCSFTRYELDHSLKANLKINLPQSNLYVKVSWQAVQLSSRPTNLPMIKAVMLDELSQIIFLCLEQKMDMSNPAAFVNAEILHFYVGRRVRALMHVVRSDGGVVIGKSTDEKQLVVKGFPPAPLTTFVEVFGIVNSDKSIAAEIWINFGDSIGIVFLPIPQIDFEIWPKHICSTTTSFVSLQMENLNTCSCEL
ncbi:hypothetical protein V8G54_020821 [Vigna mungo]|uniref:Uncharacterized protein n=1 Tax=Vigna mungo TaxID=3915 RepID=A0AAQ3NCV6_VIGMU